MKKFTTTFYLIIVLLFLGQSRLSHASKWITTGELDDISMQVDLNSINKINNCVASAVVKLFYKRGSVREIYLQQPQNGLRPSVAKQNIIVGYDINTQWFDCCKNASALVSVISFNNDGEQLDSTIFNQPQWQPFRPDTIGYVTLKTVCDVILPQGDHPRNSPSQENTNPQSVARPPGAAEEHSSGKISTGTGFLISKQGHILTNAHVVNGSTNIKIRGLDGIEYDASLIKISVKDDLAVLASNIKSDKVASFRTPATIALGESVYVYGFPLSGALSTSGNFTSGNIAALAGLADDTSLIQITAPVQPGNSGGPLLDTRGQIIGVVNSKLNSINVAMVTNDIPQNVNFAIKASVAENFLSGHGIKFTEEDSTQDLTPSAVAEKAKEFTYYIECSNTPKEKSPSISRERQDVDAFSVDQKLRSIINTIVYAVNPTALEGTKQYFSDNIMFYGKLLTKEDVFLQRAKYLARFDSLSYEILRTEINKNSSSQEYNIKALIKFYSKRGDKEHRGITETIWTVKNLNGNYVITSENSKLLERL